MNSKEALEKAIIKVGSLSELARILKWGKGNIAKVKQKGGKVKVPPYRAAQIAEILGHDIVAAYLEALAEEAKTEHERAFWLDQLNERRKKMKYA